MTGNPKVAALIVAAGKGERAGGGMPKQYRPLAGQPMLRRSIAAFARHPAVTMVQAVIGEADHERYLAATEGLALLLPVAGGNSRQHSVLHGLMALAAHKPDLVLIHDAARPLVSAALIDRAIAALTEADAAIPMLAVADTLKREDGGAWSTVARDGLMRAQTPQGFRFEEIVKAHRAFAHRGLTDDMAVAELAGLKIVRVPGEDTNMKITTPEDFTIAERLLGAAAEYRTGQGFDAHRFVAGDHVWLCGVKIPHDHGLEGHSDADAGLHALTDAILGAIGAGDIGEHFPPTDPQWRGVSSDRFLAHAAKLAQAAGASVAHCDVTLICERPKLAPHRDAMRARIAKILALDIARVSVKATTTEGMGFTGRREGIAAQAIATLRFT